MPTINVQLFSGRTIEQKRQFIEAVTRITCETLNCSAESVDIILTDVTKENWASGGALWCDKN